MIASFLVCLEFCFQKIRKKQKPDKDKNYNAFQNDDYPQLFAPFWHVAKPITIKPKYIFYNRH